MVVKEQNFHNSHAQNNAGLIRRCLLVLYEATPFLEEDPAYENPLTVNL
jgi:hypothetical protein